jgi:hypothetical protein
VDPVDPVDPPDPVEPAPLVALVDEVPLPDPTVVLPVVPLVTPSPVLPVPEGSSPRLSPFIEQEAAAAQPKAAARRNHGGEWKFMRGRSCK